MNYQKIYNDICNRGQIRVRVKEIGEYYERHHILPRCLGGNNDKLNLTLLTAREHFLCHYILAIKIYPNNHKLMYALWAMCKLENKYQNRSISSRVYEQARLSYIKMQSEKFKGKGNPQYRKLITNETRERLKEKRKLRVGINAPNYGKKLSEESRKRLSESRAGVGNYFYGKCHSVETKRKLRDKALLRPPSNNKALIDKDGNVYKSRKEFMELCNITESKMYLMFKLGQLKNYICG